MHQEIQVIYRLSDNSRSIPKFPKATKLNCLMNACKVFGKENIHLLVDTTNLNGQTQEDVERIEGLAHFEFYDGGSSAASCRKSFQYAIDNFSDGTIIYPLEDDFIHLDTAVQIALEGIEKLDIVSLYLHGDRFIPHNLGGSKYCNIDGAFDTRMFKTNNSFWVQVESTVCSFITHTKTLKEDMEIWTPLIDQSYPDDFTAFWKITQIKERTLGSPVPSQATHALPEWAAPTIGIGIKSWNDVL